LLGKATAGNLNKNRELAMALPLARPSCCSNSSKDIGEFINLT
jgi:hypothetical protein